MTRHAAFGAGSALCVTLRTLRFLPKSYILHKVRSET